MIAQLKRKEPPEIGWKVKMECAFCARLREHEHVGYHQTGTKRRGRWGIRYAMTWRCVKCRHIRTIVSWVREDHLTLPGFE